MNKRKIIIVLGPTASGKSGLAIELAKKFNGFLISADSRQVFKKMDIGTNKDVLVEKDGKYFVDGVEECLVNVVEPDELFTLEDWLKKTKEVLVNHKDQLAIIVGGTGLYIDALVNNYQLKGGLDLKLREELEKLMEEKGIVGILEKIKSIDPDIANKIDVKNPRRVIRAAEVCLSTNKPFSRDNENSEFDFLQIGINPERKILYEKINRRVDQMIDGGLVAEVKDLVSAGYDCSSSAMSGIGYRQICQFLNKEITGSKAIELIKRDTRRYAKRQVTWFKRDKNISWIQNLEEADQLVRDFLKR